MKEKIVSHTSHAKLQYYRHNYCLVSMTGVLGCRWHRYQQSTRNTRKRDFVSLGLVLMTFLYILVFLLFWLAAGNSRYFISVDMYQRVGDYIPWYGLGLGFSSATFTYLGVLLILCVLHVIHGHQLYIHLSHVTCCVLILAACVVVFILVDINWPHMWPLLYIYLKVFGPFVLLATVIVLTALSWLLIRQWFRLSSKGAKIACLSVFVGLMTGLYLCPLAIDTPIFRRDTPPKPSIVAIGGASQVSPENTMFAFRKAVELGASKLMTTVQISYDGIPFLMSDTSLLRTTNVADVLPNRTSDDPTHFNMTDLEKLSAGAWFLQDDPWGSSEGLTEAEQERVREATVPRLSALTQLAADTEGLQLYLMVRELSVDHPYSGQSFTSVLGVLDNTTGLRHPDVFVPWEAYELNPSYSLLAEATSSVWDRARERNMSAAYLPVRTDMADIIGGLRQRNVSTLVLEVNSAWFLSYSWCADADIVATHDIEELAHLNSPIIHMNEAGYLAVWVTADVLSIAAILAMFIVQRIRLYGTNFSPEAISLNTGRVRTSHRSRTMKEKLLREGAVMDSLEDSELPGAGGPASFDPREEVMDGRGSVYSMSSAAQPGGRETHQRQRHQITGSVSDGEVGLSPPIASLDRYSV